MNYYEPNPYPYYAPRLITHHLTLPLRATQLPELPSTLGPARVYQPEANSFHTRSLLLNQQIQHHLYRTLQAHERENFLAQEAQLGIEINYLKRIQELRKERQLLDQSAYLMNFSPITGLRPTHFYQGTNNMSDEELIRLYQSGARGQQYLHELKAKLGKDVINDRAQNNVSINSNVTSGKRVFQNSKKQLKEKKELVQKSYFDDLNRSRQDSMEESIFKKSKKEYQKGHTIDVFARTSEDSPFKHSTPQSQNKKANKKGRKTINNNLPSKKQHYFSSRKGQPSQIITEPALKKINNRLKVGAMVYQDSKLRHAKHEIDHLMNTFENEVRARKQIKDKINNNAEILKKHKLVVDSR